MATWLDAITGPLGAATKTVQELMEVRDLVKFGDTFRKLHGELVAAQASANSGYLREAALLKQIDSLEKEMRKFERWDEEKERYEPKSLGGQAFVHMLKKDARGTEPPHWICTHCYGRGHPETLQYIGFIDKLRGRWWQCPSCKNKITPDPDVPEWID